MSSDGGDIISTILSELGWDQNLAIPIANDENQKLIHLIESKQKKNDRNKDELTKLKDKIVAMENHLKNCRLELQFSGKLKTAKDGERVTEDHMQKVEEREIGRLNQELKKMDSKLQDIRQNKNVYENTLFKKTTELESLKQQMQWDQQALEAWLEESEKKGEDILSLQKYARQDEGKIRELSLQLERCTATIIEKKALLEKEVVETKTTHVELEKTSDEYESAHNERQNILRQWESTIEQLRRRDAEIDKLSANLALLKEEATQLSNNLKSRNEFYENLLASNSEIAKNVEQTEKQNGKLRVEQRELEEQRFNFQSELDALKRTCDRTAVDLEQARIIISQLRKEKVEKEEKREKAVMVRTEMEARLKKVQDEKLSAEEKANIADKILEEEEANHLKLEHLLKATRDQQFKKAQEVHDAEVEQKNIKAEINGNKTAVKNLNTKITKLDQELLKQQEILYTQNFNIQQLERRINRMQHGDHSSEEKEHLEASVKRLTEDLDSITKVSIVLSAQTKRVQDEIRRCNYDSQKIGSENNSVTVKLEEVNLHTERSQQELKRCRTDKERVLVDDNIMKLEVKRLRDRLYNKAEEVYSLDVRKQQLNQAARERFSEIKIHKEMLQSQIRSAEEEKSKNNADLKARLSKIDKLEKRYEILMVSMSPPEGEEEQSQAYYVIKAAQDKEELQRQGDELDAKIRKTEKEIRALENTLLLMNSCNQNYRKSLSKVTDVSEEVGVKKDLEVQLRTVMDKYNFRRRQVMQLEEDYQMLKETYDNLSKDELLYQEQVNSLMDQLTSKRIMQSKQMEKIERAEKQISKLKNDILESEKGKEFDDIDHDIEIRDLREFIRISVNELQRHIQTHFPALGNETNLLLEEGGLLIQSGSSSRSGRSSNSSNSKVGSSRHSTARSGASNAASITSSVPQSRRSSGAATSSTTKPQSGQASATMKVVDMTQFGEAISSPVSSAASNRSSKKTGGSARSSIDSRGGRIG